MVDMGTTSTRAGYAGEDTPRAMFPTSYGYIDEPDTDPAPASSDGDVTMSEANAQRSKYFIGDSKVHTWRENMEVRNPMTDGLGKSSPPPRQKDNRDHKY